MSELDVERLARAIDAVEEGGVRNGVFDRLTTIDNGRLARAIVFEYDRLAELGECGFNEAHEAHEYVVARDGTPVDLPCPGLAAPVAGLDAAWAEAEAALPTGWRIAMLNLDGDARAGYSWVAVAEGGPDDWHANGYLTSSATSPTPAAALLALAARLHERTEP